MSRTLCAAVVIAFFAGCGLDQSGTSDGAGGSSTGSGSGGRPAQPGSGGAPGTGGSGSGGSSGSGGVAGSVCTSMKTWNDTTGPLMAPGYPCLSCHSFSLGGTIYPTAHEANNCDGATGGGLSVIVTGANGQTVTMTPNAAGNFYATAPISTPFTVKVTSSNGTRVMQTPQTSGDCNSCHTVAGANGAPGRIMTP